MRHDQLCTLTRGLRVAQQKRRSGRSPPSTRRIAAPRAGAPSSQYCWWKVPKPHGGHSPGAQAAAGTGGSGVSTRKLRKLAGVTCAARPERVELLQLP